MAKSAHESATRKPAAAHTAIRYFTLPLLTVLCSLILQRKSNHESVQYCTGTVKCRRFTHNPESRWINSEGWVIASHLKEMQPCASANTAGATTRRWMLPAESVNLGIGRPEGSHRLKPLEHIGCWHTPEGPSFLRAKEGRTLRLFLPA
jgi:hypothetical protein